MSKLFILGAPDAEMAGIERVLDAHHEVHRNAEVDGKRVHAGNAYKAGTVNMPAEITEVVLVECEPANVATLRETYSVVVVDHHRPGDPGYGLPASAFWQASSLGQIYNLLGITDVPHDDLVLAAMDSHPADAIRGLCPGVSAQEVIARKIQEIAMQTHLEIGAVQEMLASFTERLNGAPTITLDTQTVADLSGVATGPDYVSIATAQTALLIRGKTALLQQIERDGARKITISGHAKPETVIAFQKEYAPAHNLERVYGVPSRGFAGGYLPTNYKHGRSGKVCH